MKKSGNSEQRCGTIGGGIFAFPHKKASFPPGCAKMDIRGVGRLARSVNYVLRLPPSGLPIFATTQHLNNLANSA